mgnify:CR=1 FL=1
MASRDKVVQSLSIALIVFVMLTFVLAVTTYLFFTQKLAAERATQEKAAEMAAAKNETRKIETDADKLRVLLGFPEGKPVEEIETDVGDAFAKNYPDYNQDSKDYTKLDRKSTRLNSSHSSVSRMPSSA